MNRAHSIIIFLSVAALWLVALVYLILLSLPMLYMGLASLATGAGSGVMFALSTLLVPVIGIGIIILSGGVRRRNRRSLYYLTWLTVVTVLLGQYYLWFFSVDYNGFVSFLYLQVFAVVCLWSVHKEFTGYPTR